MAENKNFVINVNGDGGVNISEEVVVGYENLKIRHITQERKRPHVVVMPKIEINNLCAVCQRQSTFLCGDAGVRSFSCQ